MTKKARFIERASTLSDAEKEKAIAFFNKHPVYENQIDWNSKLLQYRDFEKVFLMADNSQKSVKQKVKNNPELLFKGYNCRIVHRNKAFMIVMPLDWECAVFFNSFKCGGEGAKWCIGDRKNCLNWNFHIEKGDLFYFIYFFEEHPVWGRKLYLQYMSEYDCLTLWNQEDKTVSEFVFYPLFERICRKDMESIGKMAMPRIMEYEECSPESLLTMLEKKRKIFGDLMEISSNILKKGNEESIKQFAKIINSIHREYRDKCVDGNYSDDCILNIERNKWLNEAKNQPEWEEIQKYAEKNPAGLVNDV